MSRDLLHSVEVEEQAASPTGTSTPPPPRWHAGCTSPRSARGANAVFSQHRSAIGGFETPEPRPEHAPRVDW
jgi:hypothetical protein